MSAKAVPLFIRVIFAAIDVHGAEGYIKDFYEWLQGGHLHLRILAFLLLLF
ncbi:hypothetical protein [Scytonema hofmannii]|uniref:hypothetical protein n=1 Tax=Scytonema hofmannii TaxID=34078 RepID=UPI00034A8B27|nr:hypothetical protein [Scytonema hofmannii]